jgi:Fic family protein
LAPRSSPSASSTPFADGNGRLHRYLIHHILAERGFNQPGVVFPVSAAILDRIDNCRRTLETYSARLLPLIQMATDRRGQCDGAQ